MSLQSSHEPSNHKTCTSLKSKGTNMRPKINKKIRISKHLHNILTNKKVSLPLHLSISDQILINNLQKIKIICDKEQILSLTALLSGCFQLTTEQTQTLIYISEKAKQQSENILSDNPLSDNPLSDNPLSDNGSSGYGKLLARIKYLNISKENILKTLQYVEFEIPLIIRIKPAALNLLADDTHYRNQFETQTSGGTMNNVTRRRWENLMFNNIYDNASPFDRCKYGTFDTNYYNNKKYYSVAISYGYSYFVLKPHMRSRTTCCYDDSSAVSNNPKLEFGTLKDFAHILAKFSDNELMNIVSFVNKIPYNSTGESSYKELQFHGPIVIDRDVESLVVCGHDKRLLPKETIDKFDRRGIKIVYEKIEIVE